MFYIWFSFKACKRTCFQKSLVEQCGCFYSHYPFEHNITAFRDLDAHEDIMPCSETSAQSNKSKIICFRISKMFYLRISDNVYLGISKIVYLGISEIVYLGISKIVYLELVRLSTLESVRLYILESIILYILESHLHTTNNYLTNILKHTLNT
jgi:hypothetical protein